MKDYFSRQALIDRLKEEAQDVLQQGIEELLKAALRELGLPEVIHFILFFLRKLMQSKPMCLLTKQFSAISVRDHSGD